MEENKYILKCRRDGIKDPYQALQEFGYQKIQDFLNDHPNKSFTEILLMLFKKIDHYYTRRAFFGCLREEIKKDGTAREVIKDGLVRLMKEYNISWKRTSRAINNRIDNVWGQIGDLTDEVPMPSAMMKFWEYLEYRVPPQYDWIPENSDDPLLTEVFDKLWPVNKKNQNVGNVEKTT